MKILVRRYCKICNNYTRWKIEPDGKYWETHTCTECKTSQEYKTR
jgi:hypothetical protein